MESLWEDAAKSLRRSSKANCLFKYRDKSDDELEELLDNCRRFAMSIPASRTSEYLSDLAKKAGEADACLEILENRKKEREKAKKEEEKRQKEKELENKKIHEAKKWWESKYLVRKVKTLQRCPITMSYNGQIVVAIIEGEKEIGEDKLYEIFNEVEKMELDSFNKLLTDLQTEEAICKHEKNDSVFYALINNNDELFYDYNYMSEDDYRICHFMSAKPQSAYYENEIINECLCDSNALHALVKSGKLGRFKHGDLPNYFYYPMMIKETMEDAK